MIILYSGTPGSGKSLHCASNIYYNLKYGHNEFLCNFPINMDYFKPSQRERFHFIENKDITPDFLQSFSSAYFSSHPAKNVRDAEGRIKLYIDEAQILFNAREWQKTYRDGWTRFFSIHRHLGYDIYLISQFDRMLDRQIRSLIEYEYSHRKISNIGSMGKFVNLLCAGGLFYSRKLWYPQHDKVGGEFFRYKRKYDRLYDTHQNFTEEGVSASVTATGDGAPGAVAEVDITVENPT